MKNELKAYAVIFLFLGFIGYAGFLCFDSMMNSGIGLLAKCVSVPYGRMLHCSFKNDLQHKVKDKALIGVLDEDFDWDGKVVFPKGSEVHGSYSYENDSSFIPNSNWHIVNLKDSFSVNLSCSMMSLDGKIFDPNEKDDFSDQIQNKFILYTKQDFNVRIHHQKD